MLGVILGLSSIIYGAVGTVDQRRTRNKFTRSLNVIKINLQPSEAKFYRSTCFQYFLTLNSASTFFSRFQLLEMFVCNFHGNLRMFIILLRCSEIRSEFHSEHPSERTLTMIEHQIVLMTGLIQLISVAKIEKFISKFASPVCKLNFIQALLNSGAKHSLCLQT